MADGILLLATCGKKEHKFTSRLEVVKLLFVSTILYKKTKLEAKFMSSAFQMHNYISSVFYNFC